MVSVSGVECEAGPAPVRRLSRFLPLAIAIVTGLLVVPGAFNAPRTQVRWTWAPVAPNSNGIPEEIHTEPVENVQHGPERRFVRPGDGLPAELLHTLQWSQSFQSKLYLGDDSVGVHARLFRVQGWRRTPPPDDDDNVRA